MKIVIHFLPLRFHPISKGRREKNSYFTYLYSFPLHFPPFPYIPFCPIPFPSVPSIQIYQSFPSHRYTSNPKFLPPIAKHFCLSFLSTETSRILSALGLCMIPKSSSIRNFPVQLSFRKAPYGKTGKHTSLASANLVYFIDLFVFFQFQHSTSIPNYFCYALEYGKSQIENFG